MKKLFLAVLSAILPFVASAASDEEILDKIEKANASLPAAQSHFDHSRFIKASGKTINMEGAMYFVPPEKLRMQYTTPATDLMMINANIMYIRRSSDVGNVFNTDKNQMMAVLRNSLLYSIRGKMRDVARENDGNITVTEEAKNYVVTVSAKKKAPRGYSRITVTFRKSDCLPVVMVMEEFSGTVNTYTMSDIITRKPADSVFDIPKK
ncbi:MAG: outer membrane lipoprotein carrier protein LolA [Bacteroidales bacterium]|nr:outer membrane lipoprotein carrier protein LolA [Bacteroidales bacterium]